MTLLEKHLGRRLTPEQVAEYMGDGLIMSLTNNDLERLAELVAVQVGDIAVNIRRLNTRNGKNLP